MENTEISNVYGGYSIIAASCGWKAGGVTVVNEQNIYVWGEGGIDLPGVEVRELGKWYRLKNEVKGDNISLYVDDDLVFERRDKSNPSGGVALWVYDAIVEFDNVVVTGDDIPDTGPGGYAVEPEAKLSTTWGWLKR